MNIGNVTRAWPAKASVRAWFPDFAEDGESDQRLDYPLSALPPCEFHDPAAFEENRRSIANGLWQQYNWRTIQAEERVALPAIDLLMRRESISDDVKEGLLQTSVDEKFHTYFHTLALWDARRRAQRPLHEPGATQRTGATHGLIESVTVRMVTAALRAEPDPEVRELIQIAYAAVAEVSVNAFLEVLSRSTEIREVNRALVDQHNRDERFHTVTFIEAVRQLLEREPAAVGDVLRAQISSARHSFLLHDLSMYEQVFGAHGVSCTFGSSPGTMSRDMTGIDRLLAVAA